MFHKSNVNKTVQFFLALLKYREVITVKTITLHKKLIFFIKNLKSNKKKLVQKNGWAIQESLFAYTNQFSTFFTPGRIQKCLT